MIRVPLLSGGSTVVPVAKAQRVGPLLGRPLSPIADEEGAEGVRAALASPAAAPAVAFRPPTANFA